MKKASLFMIGIASLVVSNVCSAQTTQEMGDIYVNRCANCHGATANGVPQIKEQSGVKSEEAGSHGIASQQKTNIYGPALNTLTLEELVAKLIDLRSKGFESHYYDSVMRENLKNIEEREGKVSDEKMAEYIYNTFGEGAE